MDHDVRVAALVDELAALETRLDPEQHGKDRRVADLVTVGMLLPFAIALDWHAQEPLLMIAMMVGALWLKRIPQWVTRFRLRRQQDRLFREYNRILELANATAELGETDHA